jgi:hypothetical protein
VSARSVGIENSAIPERKKFPLVARGVSKTEEALLGSTFVGEGIFLCDSRNDNRRDD